MYETNGGTRRTLWKRVGNRRKDLTALTPSEIDTDATTEVEERKASHHTEQDLSLVADHRSNHYVPRHAHSREDHHATVASDKKGRGVLVV